MPLRPPGNVPISFARWSAISEVLPTSGGGHVYPALIRKTENKPLRVFLQDGSNDLDNAHGNWWLGNLQMEKALQFRKYDHRAVWGEGSHNGKHGGAIFPDTMRWLWRDWKGTE